MATCVLTLITIVIGQFSENTIVSPELRESEPCERVPIKRDYALLYDAACCAKENIEPIPVTAGPHLFIDDYFIATSKNIKRVVNVLQRDPGIPNPIIDGKNDGCFQPFLSVFRDESTGRFRMWFGHRVENKDHDQSHIGYTESNDGIHWDKPVRVLKDPAPIRFGVSIIDDGSNGVPPEKRFKYAWWNDGGLKIATSSDGLVWTPICPQPVLFHNHDINGVFYDKLRQRYVAIVSVFRSGDTWEGNRRITMQSCSPDLLRWTRPHYILLPDPIKDQGETQFYAINGFITRGELIIGMAKILRDDVKVDDPPDPPDAFGMGYTQLVWTRDGKTWVRDPQPFFLPNPEKGAWDHAHAWVDEQILVNDNVYLYYAGYARGHKVDRFEERQIGLVIMKRDRYVGRQASQELGTITTPLLILKAKSMTVNADAKDGEIRVQVCNAEGRPLPGFAFHDCISITEDGLDLPVSWGQPIERLGDLPVHLEFELKNATLYGFSTG